ncbi:zinc finger, C3HC4 type (RING finger) domain-containing protein [Toxoplasma gondii MAS]|uniref:RING-type E3 ubiquitin transferase n=2 Tax=Toxoplasma gondii TaxID=5811 RepID=A0A086QTS4_TOXGO|nr:zinc finger, C3HC4 type (RING finger) domain-containing protein [Toxoplasma gondii MAS]PUA90696.1 zinc finger, C3HC4 type (RING finger) domain-containing protein [Toxoplasma gondii TgCATBr9]
MAAPDHQFKRKQSLGEEYCDLIMTDWRSLGSFYQQGAATSGSPASPCDLLLECRPSAHVNKNAGSVTIRFLSTRFACLTPEVPGRIQQQRQTRPPCRLLAILLAVQAALSLRAVAVFVCRRIRLQRMYELVTGTSSRDMLESMSAGVDRARSEENQAHAVVPTSPAASLANTDEAPVLHSGEYEVNSTTQPRRHPEFRNTNIEETKEKREIEDDGNVSCDEKANGMACLFCQGKCRGPTATACGHIYCWRCITRWILQQQRDQTAAACPVCRAACPPQDLVLLRHYRPSKGLLSTQPHSFRSPF